jgi:beta-lactamase class A
VSRRYAAAVALVWTLSCGVTGPHPESAGVPDAGSKQDSGDAGSSPDAGSAVPAAIEQQLTWVLAALNGAAVTGNEVAAHFTPAFLTQASATTVISVFSTLSPQAPWRIVGYEGAVMATALTAQVTRSDGEYWRLQIAIDPTEANLISGLELSPAGDLDPSLQSYSAIDQALQAVAPDVDLLTATIGSGSCTPIHELNPTASLALGSSFKLWVLATLAQSISEGTLAWTTTIPIQDMYKSLPSGMLQNVPDGTMLPLLTFAEDMISISDNTAADHLIWEVGRANVEAMLATTSHHDPAEDEPFLTTREMFVIKLLLSMTDQQAWISSTTDQKRTLLAQYDATLDPRTYDGPAWVNPILIQQMEWFATTGDLCNVMSALKAYGDMTATQQVYDILSINPGVPDAAGLFSYVGYKGGSEPGVETLNWLLQRKSDSAWVFLSLGVNDPDKPVNGDAVAYLAQAARAILGRGTGG